ncbi:hypothetical protein NQ317_014991 [Molorchus minor]|uniref:Tudor domain-containing protein n=1 Tax=Molorchus minor TaxID=1323400 RepID=A0ABQ9J6D1_9CUCU|nr:hypothetical protein NQ317_014991 [Molorchus minor]
MNLCYTDAESHYCQTPYQRIAICAAYSVDAWYRAMVLSTDTDTEISYVKILDLVVLAYVENSQLRQIRGDFMLLPFQAAECILANIKSVNGPQSVSGYAEWVTTDEAPTQENAEGAVGGVNA